ncbi:MAG: hypothetical protein ABSD47_03655 [Candidatus Methylomirabilota bacterium]|jgi:hypothetical protein
MNNAIGRVTSILSIPYGYTVSLWAAGALTVHRLGSPSEFDVLLFVIGAVAAFVALAGVGREHLDAEIPMRVPSLVVVNFFPILVALLVVAFPAPMVGRSLGYFANSFLATAAYILSLAALIWGTRIIRDRGQVRQAAPKG